MTRAKAFQAPPPPPAHRVSVVDRTAVCACGWTSRQLRAGRVGEFGQVSTAQQRAIAAAAQHLRRHGQP